MLFRQLPIAAVIKTENLLAMSGGLSPNLKTFQDINSIERNAEPSELYDELLWSTPDLSVPMGPQPPPRPNQVLFPKNTLSGAGYLFTFACLLYSSFIFHSFSFLT